MNARADASDRLSPIIVKELRQGVRGHVFTGAFLLQMLLLLGIGTLGLLFDTSAGSREVFTFFFWAFVTLPLVIILPLGAGVSISGELAANTLEPVLLTRLTPWRLVAGKWAATASQAVVLGIATLPFVLVRYYLGSVEIVADLAFLGAYVGCSLLLASVAVALSPARLSALFRWALMVALGLTLAISYLVTLANATYGRVFLAHSTRSLSLLGFLAVVALSILAALEAAALQIGPPALARPLRLRLLALLALAVGGGLMLSPHDEVSTVAVAWAAGLVLVTTVAAICEQAPPLRARYAGFFRRRAFLPLAWVLAPGWPAGVAFLLLVAVTAAVAVAWHGPIEETAFVLAGAVGTLLLPLVVWRTFLPRARPFLLFLLVTLVSVALSTVAPVGMHTGSPSWWKAGCVLLPLCPAAYGLARIGGYGDYGDSPLTMLPFHTDVLFGCVVAVVVAAALWHTARAWRQIGRLVRQPPPA